MRVCPQICTNENFLLKSLKVGWGWESSENEHSHLDDIQCLEDFNDTRAKTLVVFPLPTQRPQTLTRTILSQWTIDCTCTYMCNQIDKIEPNKFSRHCLVLFSTTHSFIFFHDKVYGYLLYCFSVSYVFMKIVFTVSDNKNIFYQQYLIWKKESPKSNSRWDISIDYNNEVVLAMILYKLLIQ